MPLSSDISENYKKVLVRGCFWSTNVCIILDMNSVVDFAEQIVLSPTELQAIE